MLCWICGATASATCRFCGRATCKDHARTQPFLFEAWAVPDGTLLGLAVDDAIHCGVCKLQPEPVDVGFLIRSTTDGATGTPAA